MSSQNELKDNREKHSEQINISIENESSSSSNCTSSTSTSSSSASGPKKLENSVTSHVINISSSSNETESYSVDNDSLEKIKYEEDTNNDEYSDDHDTEVDDNDFEEIEIEEEDGDDDDIAQNVDNDDDYEDFDVDDHKDIDDDSIDKIDIEDEDEDNIYQDLEAADLSTQVYGNMDSEYVNDDNDQLNAAIIINDDVKNDETISITNNDDDILMDECTLNKAIICEDDSTKVNSINETFSSTVQKDTNILEKGFIFTEVDNKSIDTTLDKEKSFLTAIESENMSANELDIAITEDLTEIRVNETIVHSHNVEETNVTAETVAEPNTQSNSDVQEHARKSIDTTIDKEKSIHTTNKEKSIETTIDTTIDKEKSFITATENISTRDFDEGENVQQSTAEQSSSEIRIENSHQKPVTEENIAKEQNESMVVDTQSSQNKIVKTEELHTEHDGNQSLSTINKAMENTLSSENIIKSEQFLERSEMAPLHSNVNTELVPKVVSDKNTDDAQKNNHSKQTSTNKINVTETIDIPSTSLVINERVLRKTRARSLSIDSPQVKLVVTTPSRRTTRVSSTDPSTPMDSPISSKSRGRSEPKTFAVKLILGESDTDDANNSLSKNIKKTPVKKLVSILKASPAATPTKRSTRRGSQNRSPEDDNISVASSQHSVRTTRSSVKHGEHCESPDSQKDDASVKSGKSGKSSKSVTSKRVAKKKVALPAISEEVTNANTNDYAESRR